MGWEGCASSRQALQAVFLRAGLCSGSPFPPEPPAPGGFCSGGQGWVGSSCHGASHLPSPALILEEGSWGPLWLAGRGGNPSAFGGLNAKRILNEEV